MERAGQHITYIIDCKGGFKGRFRAWAHSGQGEIMGEASSVLAVRDLDKSALLRESSFLAHVFAVA